MIFGPARSFSPTTATTKLTNRDWSKEQEIHFRISGSWSGTNGFTDIYIQVLVQSFWEASVKESSFRVEALGWVLSSYIFATVFAVTCGVMCRFTCVVSSTYPLIILFGSESFSSCPPGFVERKAALQPPSSKNQREQNKRPSRTGD